MMNCYFSEAEKDERFARLAAARSRWLGVELDYDGYTRIVNAVSLDDRDRLILHASLPGEWPAYSPELASSWETD